jgi:anti-sigma factor (TIGR02949 family)
MIDPCAKCEEVLQPFLDRELTEAERQEAEAHLDECSYCRKRYRFEVELRRYVRRAVAEPMPPELKARLAKLARSTPLEG